MDYKIMAEKANVTLWGQGSLVCNWSSDVSVKETIISRG